MNPAANFQAQPVPESLGRYLDGEAPGVLRPCRAFNCPGLTASGAYCPHCQEEIDALRAMRIRREARIAERAARRAARKTLRQRWNALLNFAPSDSQVRHMSAWLEHAGRVANNALLLFVIGVMIYLICEVGSAFLPGGPVERILRGGQ